MTPLIKQPKAKQPIKIIDFGTKKPRLSIDGHIYHFGHQQAGYQLYYCQNRTRSNCMASLKYWTKELRYRKFGLHNHPADGVKAEALLVQQQIVHNAISQPAIRPRMLITQSITGVHQEVVDRLPPRPSLARLVRKKKADVGFKMTEPKSLEEIDTDELRKLLSLDDEPLLHKDSGLIQSRDGHMRYIVFSTEKLLSLLQDADCILVDGTFDVWVILARVLYTFVPVVISLLTHKVTSLYVGVLQSLGKLPNLRYSMSDMEKAELSAIEQVFPNIKLFTDQFHFEKALRTKFEEIGWMRKREYTRTEELQTLLKQFYYLGFAKAEDVPICFSNLITELEDSDLVSWEDLTAFRAYMERTYVGKYDKDWKLVKAPIYSIEFWNSYFATIKLGFRTNNPVESWNLQYSESINCRGKPSLVLFLNFLRYEVCHVKLCIADINQERSPVLSQTEAAIREVIYRYDLYDPADFEVYFKDLVRAFEHQIA